MPCWLLHEDDMHVCYTSRVCDRREHPGTLPRQHSWYLWGRRWKEGSREMRMSRWDVTGGHGWQMAQSIRYASCTPYCLCISLNLIWSFCTDCWFGGPYVHVFNFLFYCICNIPHINILHNLSWSEVVNLAVSTKALIPTPPPHDFRPIWKPFYNAYWSVNDQWGPSPPSSRLPFCVSPMCLSAHILGWPTYCRDDGGVFRKYFFFFSVCSNHQASLCRVRAAVPVACHHM